MTGPSPKSQRRLYSPDDVVAEAVARIASAGWERFNQQLRHTGGCAQPVRLKGTLRRADLATGELSVAYDSSAEPNGVLLKACQARRATRCPACAGVYKADARQLILAGLVGGKGVSAEVVGRPLVFVSLLAPSFGPVHTRPTPPGPCHPEPLSCPCGRPHQCQDEHSQGDVTLGTPLCPGTYDYQGAVMWNNRAGELWRRTVIATRRHLARHLGATDRSFNEKYRLSYLKVVEYQARGLVHLHALLRLDPAPGTERVPELLDVGLLVAALNQAAQRTTAPNPMPGSPAVGWGTRSLVEPVALDGRQRLAAYLAKYTTKSVDSGGALDHRLARGELATLVLSEHLRQLVQAAWDLGGDPALKRYRLREWAHTLGYRGHWVTKSPSWSTTLTALRQARRQYHVRGTDEPANSVQFGHWDYRGSGHQSEGDAWLAEAHRNNRQLNRRTWWEEQ